MGEKWKKIPSRDGMWYMLSDQGNIYREREVWVDEKGTIRGKNAKNRKIHKEIRQYPVRIRFNKQTNCYEACITKKGSKIRSSKETPMHILVAENFVPKPANSVKMVIAFKDGDRKNYKASNLEWIRFENQWWVEQMRKPPEIKEHVQEHIKIYKIPDWCILYAKYTQYLKNRDKTKDIILGFMREEGLYCGLIKTGWDEKITKNKDGNYESIRYPYFMISDNDIEVVNHDKEKLGQQLRSPKHGYYPLRKNSAIMKRWMDRLTANDNFQILDVPSVMEYVVLHNAKKVKAGQREMYSRAFAMEGDDLYLRIQSQHPFEVSSEFIEAKGKEYLFNE